MTEPRDESRWYGAALRAASVDGRPRADCPPADRIWDAVRLELPIEERLAIVDHTVECAVCAEAWRLATELGQHTAAAGQKRSPFLTRLQTPGARQLLYAATLVAALGALLLARLSKPTVDPIVRDTSLVAVRSEIQPSASLPRDDFRLRWSGAPEGSRYDLTVTTAELNVVVTARGLEQPEYRVASEHLETLAPGTRVLWRVVAHTVEGTTMSSPTFEVFVR